MKLYVIGYYNEDKSSEFVTLITAHNDDEAWWKGQCWMNEMLGRELDWLMETKTIEVSTKFANLCLQEKYRC